MSLPHTILEVPTIKSIDLIGEKELSRRADDEIYLESRSFTSGVKIEFGIGAILFGLGILYYSEKNSDIILPLILIGIGLFMIILGVLTKRKNKIFELNRLKGMVTYPDSFLRPPLKGPFKDLKAVLSVTGNIDGYVDGEYLKFVNTFNPRKVGLLYTFYGNEPKQDWSFFVWYMDKNRPLPPGTAFDPYRQKDFERRKASKFPKPLYPSNIPTPEATPEQQKERNKIGGW